MATVVGARLDLNNKKHKNIDDYLTKCKQDNINFSKTEFILAAIEEKIARELNGDISTNIQPQTPIQEPIMQPTFIPVPAPAPVSVVAAPVPQDAPPALKLADPNEFAATTVAEDSPGKRSIGAFMSDWR